MKHYFIVFIVSLLWTLGIGIWAGIEVGAKCHSILAGVLAGIAVVFLEWALLGFAVCMDGYIGNIDDNEND
jgi:hypothetical protein